MRIILLIISLSVLELVVAQCNYNDTPDYTQSNLTTCQLVDHITTFTGELIAESDTLDIIEFIPPVGMEIFEIEIIGNADRFIIMPFVDVSIYGFSETYEISVFQNRVVIPFGPGISDKRTLIIQTDHCIGGGCDMLGLDYEVIVRSKLVVNIDNPDLPSFCSSVVYELNDNITQFNGFLSPGDERDEWHLNISDSYIIDSVVLNLFSQGNLTTWVSVCLQDLTFSIQELGKKKIHSWPITERSMRIGISYGGGEVEYNLVVYTQELSPDYCNPNSCNFNDSPDYQNNIDYSTPPMCCISGDASFDGKLVPVIGDNMDIVYLNIAKPIRVLELTLSFYGANGQVEVGVDYPGSGAGGSIEMNSPGSHTFSVIPEIETGYLWFYIRSESDQIWNCSIRTMNFSTNEWKGENSFWSSNRNWTYEQPHYSTDVLLINEDSIFYPVITDCGLAKTLSIEQGAQLTVLGELNVIPK